MRLLQLESVQTGAEQSATALAADMNEHVKCLPGTTSPRRLLHATAVTAVVLATAGAVRVPVIAPRHLLEITRPPGPTPSSRLTPRLQSCTRLYSKSAGAVTEAGIHLDHIISDIQARIANSPKGLDINKESRPNAEDEDVLSRCIFEVDGDGNLVGGEVQQESRLAQALSLGTFVLVRVTCPRAVASLAKLSGAAEDLLGNARTVDEKLESFGPMQDNGGGMVTGYAGGDDYGFDQFLETRGRGPGTLVPEIEADPALRVMEGRRALSRLSCGILRAVAQQTLSEPDANAFLKLVDGGDGGGTSASTRGQVTLSSSPQRLCRYAGPGGVAFGAHTDTTFLTAIPCASTPGLEIVHPASGRWLRPEAVSISRPGSDVMFLAGELLQALGRGRYRAAVHRVVRPAGMLSPQPRVSTPLLLRGVAGATVPGSLLPKRGTDNDSSSARSEQDEITMTSLWAALQFRAGGEATSPAEEKDGDTAEAIPSLRHGRGSPLALARSFEGGKNEIRKIFGPFAPGGVTVLSTDPLLLRLHGFASRSECDAIVASVVASCSAFADELEESTTWGGADAQGESSGARRSSTSWVADETLAVLGELTARVSGISGLPVGFMEKWQVARYKPQGYFRLHTDHVEAFNDLRCGGRLSTLILYLNDDFKGGQTDFPGLGISVEPTTGDAIYFHNVKVPVERHEAEEMVTDERSRHAGLCVGEGDKWIATKWMHPLPYPDGVIGPETREQAGWGGDGETQGANGSIP